MALYLKSLLEAKPYTARSWLYDGVNGNAFLEPDVVLKKWTAILRARLENGDEFEKNVFQFDISQTEKYQPQGGHEPIAELLDSVVLPSFEMSNGTYPAFDEPEWEEAIQMAYHLLHDNGVHDLSPRQYSRVVDDMQARDTLESNSGWPDFTRRNKPEVKSAAIAAATSGEWKTYPAIALFRRYNGKTRLVWMFPLAVNIVEGSFYQPLQDAIARSPRLIDNFFCPWKGFEAVRALVTKVYQNLRKQIAASDFTSTDAHFQKRATQEVLKVLRPLFRPQFREKLEESLMYMHEIPLIIGPDQMLTGDHGVSSGSNWTNFIETIFDNILGYYLFLKLSRAVEGLYAIGDDMAWVSDNFDESFRDKLEELGKAAGQIIRADKTMVEPDKVKTLQRLFQRNYSRPDGMLRGVYSTIRALKSSIYPERFHTSWNSDMFCARQFMILENCVDHPLFKDFVKFVCKGNRHLIPFAKKSSQELDQIHRKANLIPGLNPTYNQEKRDQSLAAFESIRVAREL